MLASARRHYLAQLELADRARRLGRRAWLVGGGAAALVSLQQEAAAQAEAAVAAMLAEQSIAADPEGIVQPAAFAGAASDGGSLTSLVASVGSQAGMERLFGTQVADAGRSATGAALTARPTVQGYVRATSGATCARCAILAGRFYRWSAGFLRHPNCFPAGVMVSGPSQSAATRRWYQGELVIIRTASGQELPATGNHPVLTDRGWLPANLLQEGDNVLRCLDGKGAVPLVVPDEHQMPSRIEDLWSAGGVVALGQVPSAPEDFHGDGGHSEVDIVFRDGLLGYGAESALAQFGQHEQFAGGVAQAALLALLGAGQQGFGALLGAPHGGVSGSGLSQALIGGHSSGTHPSRAGSVPGPHPLALKSKTNDVAGHAESFGEAVLTLPGGVGGGNVSIGENQVSARWDAPAGSFSMDNRAAYASRGHDLREGLAGQVELDCVIDLRRVGWSGHVFNLTSIEGWYSANGLIVSNCDCIHTPTDRDVAPDLVTDPMELFRSGQIRGMSKADMDAVNDGADLGQVVNVRRKKAGLTVAGRVLSRGGRPTPEGIYRAAASRGEAIELLKRHRYIR